MPPSAWLALMIGSSRLHWAWFAAGELKATWDLPHLPENVVGALVQSPDFSSIAVNAPDLPANLPLWIASVVPSQTQLWQTYPFAQVLTLEQVPVGRLYSTLGIDRALSLCGAGNRYGFPVLVIDAGTALTVTGADSEGNLHGGAILPGLQLQMRSLHEHTAALPALSTETLAMPPRWANNTPQAIQSGILYMLLAGLHDFVEAWLQSFAHSAIVLTGGDSQLLSACIAQRFPSLAAKITTDPQIIFWGMQAVLDQTVR
ncbi:pantothenate kinase [Phormidium tenue FACHB-886]|nr:pantothenate kinase [Phormidium tenue FACHB-886]